MEANSYDEGVMEKQSLAVHLMQRVENTAHVLFFSQLFTKTGISGQQLEHLSVPRKE